MGKGKNLFGGFLRAAIYTGTSILVPYYTFKYIRELTVAGYNITLSNQLYNRIIFWILAIGIVTVAFAFGVGASPKRTKRQAIFKMGQTIANVFYVIMYKFSGASRFTLVFDFGFVTFDVGLMLRLWLGVIALKLLLELYELIDAIIYQNMIKWKKGRLEKLKSYKEQVSQEGTANISGKDYDTREFDEFIRENETRASPPKTEEEGAGRDGENPDNDLNNLNGGRD